MIRPHEVDKAHDWFERYGDAAVFFSRLLPVIRTFISLPAGVVRMPFWRFTLYTVLGCLPWTFALAWFGYVLGRSLGDGRRGAAAVLVGDRGRVRAWWSLVVYVADAGATEGTRPWNTPRSTPRSRHRAGRVAARRPDDLTG